MEQLTKKTFHFAKQSLLLAMGITGIVAFYEVFQSCIYFKDGMNIFDFGSFATKNMTGYCIVLILANLILLPMALLLYKQSGISLKQQIYSKDTLGRDIIIGCVGIAITAILSLAYSFVTSYGYTQLANKVPPQQNAGSISLEFVTLVVVSGICKEIYFRGFAKHFGASAFRESCSLLLFNILFAVLDWFNFGFSFFAGLIWIFLYKKTNHLITPMIAHGGTNLVSIVYYIIMQSI